MRRILRLSWIAAVTGFLLVACATTGGSPGSGSLAFSAGSVSVAEGAGTVTIEVTRSGGTTGAASIAFAFSDASATAGSDYTATASPSELSWADGQGGTKSVTVPIIDDAVDESDETFTVSLTNAAGAAIGSPQTVTVTIQDDDGPVPTTPTVVSTDPSGGEAGVALNRNIAIEFSEAMNQAATEAAFAASPGVTCAFSWNAAGDTLTCNPTSDLTANQSYTITIGTGAEDLAGENLAGAFTFDFTTGATTLPACVFGTDTFGNCVFGS